MVNNTYDKESISILSFREGVRSRIQMYLGSDDNEGTYQALKEIINNATDEANAGYGDKIEIKLNEALNMVEVRDYGRGVPFGIRESDGQNALVAVYTQGHAGAKFDDNDSYRNASGLNGIGGSCVCLSSSEFRVISYRGGKMAVAKFSEGELQSYEETENYFADDKVNQAFPDGTDVLFSPDPKVFKNGEIGYSYERICKDIEDISYLYPNITFIVRVLREDGSTGEEVYHAEGGIADFIKDNLTGGAITPIIQAELRSGDDSMEIALQWGSSREENYVFVNGLRCPEGGSPVTGAKTAITKTFNSLAKTSYSGEVIRQNLFYVINCQVARPSFANQTKTKINNENLRTMASNLFTSAIKDFFESYPKDFNTLVDYFTRVDKAEKAAERAKKQILEASREIEKNASKKVFNSDKLKDAEFLGPDATLLLVEGDSAAGAMIKARDYKHYGILGLRGKMINAFSNSEEKLIDNEEIKLLLKALNIVPGKYNPAKLRYGRVGICTDSDSDGFHIGLLAMVNLQYFAPQFIQEQRLCWLRSPLYIVKNGKEEEYYFTDEEMNKARPTIKGEVQRNKGLGSLTPEQARRSMFTPEFQRMDILKPSTEALTLLNQLMGDDVSFRKDFIFNKIDFNEIRE